MSIFKEYYADQQFNDRFLQDAANAVDVIIPVYHTNELWHANLVSIYREVPVRRLLISDGGVIDNSLEVVRRFPRVEIFDHRQYKSLGKCISLLIKEVSSEWFIYLHSDVYLPDGWFNTMAKHQSTYDWYGCPMNITVLINYRLNEPQRPYAGSQMGRKAAFLKGIDSIDDDYVYRQEDFVFNKIVEDAGFATGKVEDTFHYHQLMYRKTQGFDLNVERVNVVTKPNPAEHARMVETQVRGIVKYLDPVEPFMIRDFRHYARELVLSGQTSFPEFKNWVSATNAAWLPYLQSIRFGLKLRQVKTKLKKWAAKA